MDFSRQYQGLKFKLYLVLFCAFMSMLASAVTAPQDAALNPLASGHPHRDGFAGSVVPFSTLSEFLR